MISEKMALTIEEAADYTGIGRNTMRQLIEWKAMPVLRVGRKILIQKEMLEKFLLINQNINLRNRNDIRPIKHITN